MIVTKYQLADAQREAAQDRAHEMCISKIQQLDEQNKRLTNELESAMTQIKVANEDFNEERLFLRARIAKFTTDAPIVNGVDDLPSY